MNCFSCQNEMKADIGSDTEYFKMKILECPHCESKADVFYHPSTNLIRKVLWEEKITS